MGKILLWKDVSCHWCLGKGKGQAPTTRKIAKKKRRGGKKLHNKDRVSVEKGGKNPLTTSQPKKKKRKGRPSEFKKKGSHCKKVIPNRKKNHCKARQNGAEICKSQKDRAGQRQGLANQNTLNHSTILHKGSGRLIGGLGISGVNFWEDKESTEVG